jgi:hypothetical protein
MLGNSPKLYFLGKITGAVGGHSKLDLYMWSIYLSYQTGRVFSTSYNSLIHKGTQEHFIISFLLVLESPA